MGIAILWVLSLVISAYKFRHMTNSASPYGFLMWLIYSFVASLVVTSFVGVIFG